MDAGRVLIIGRRGSHLFTWGEEFGCQMVARGDSQARLAEAVAAMGAVDVDLVVLDGHGSWRKARFLSGEQSPGIDFTPPRLHAAHVIMSVCYGGLEHYVRAVHERSPHAVVVGPTGEIGSPSYGKVVKHLIRRYLDGTDPAVAVNETRALGLRHAERWHCVPPQVLATH